MERVQTEKYSPAWWIVPKGRIGRLAFIERTSAIPLFPLLDHFHGPLIKEMVGGELARLQILLIAALWIAFCACNQRLHDIGKGRSGWWLGIIGVGLMLVALNIHVLRAYYAVLATFAQIFVLYSFALCAPGNKLKNRHGPPPDGRDCLSLLLLRQINKTLQAIARPRLLVKVYGAICALRRCIKSRIVRWTLTGVVLIYTMTVSFAFIGVAWGLGEARIDRLLGARSLDRAVRHNIPWAVDMWIAMGVSANGRDKEGMTPLHRASTVEIVDKLLEAGGDVNVQGQSEYLGIAGITPLHLTGGTWRSWRMRFKGYADAETQLKIVRRMLEAGADASAQDENGRTPLHYVIKFRNDYDPPDPETVNILVQAGAEENLQDQDGRTPLHYLYMKTYKSDPDTIKISEVLTQAGADVNAQDRNGKTPLHYAVDGASYKFDTFDPIKILIQTGADVNARDQNGKTPLDYATNEPKGSNVADILIKAGANTNTEN